MADEIIAEVTKNKAEKVVIALRTFRGHSFVDCRVHYTTGGAWFPTRKGLALSRAQWNEVVAQLIKVL